MAEHSKACCSLPTVTPNGYETKGKTEKIGGLDTYYVSPSNNPSRAIVCIYDIFGFAPQTLQGADMLSHALDCLVVMPDFFEGAPANHAWFPPTTDELKEKQQTFMKDKALNIPVHLSNLKAVVAEIRSKWPSVENVGAYGLCWGGKITALASFSGTDFAASGQTHPGRLEAADAEKINIPHIVLASKDEPADVVAEYKKILETGAGKTGVVLSYDTMPHGWMGARGALDDAENLKQYEHGYKQFAEFFGKYL